MDECESMHACKAQRFRCGATSLAHTSHLSLSLENHLIHTWGSCLICLPGAPTAWAHPLRVVQRAISTLFKGTAGWGRCWGGQASPQRARPRACPHGSLCQPGGPPSGGSWEGFRGGIRRPGRRGCVVHMCQGEGSSSVPIFLGVVLLVGFYTSLFINASLSSSRF